MKKAVAAVTAVLMMGSVYTSVAVAAETTCPAEVGQAKKMLLDKQHVSAKVQDVQAPRSLAGARQDIQAPRSQDVQAPRSQEVQAPRSLAGARQDIQAPRSQDVQAPRTQDVQAPRGKQDIQAPRTQDIQAPRTQDVQAPRSDTIVARGGELSKAASLVKEAEAACKAGNAGMATQKAKAAMEAMK